MIHLLLTQTQYPVSESKQQLPTIKEKTGLHVLLFAP